MNISGLATPAPVVDVYIAPLGSGSMGSVYPPARQARIDASAGKNQRRQRYFVWKLLEYAMEKSFGLHLEEQAFSVDEAGKWRCDGCFFSLSHSRDGVAVAVSNRPVGVDLESLEREPAPGLEKKILTEQELLVWNSLAEPERKTYLLEKWCAKESLYKAFDGLLFNPRQMETGANTLTGTVSVGGQAYVYAVATDYLEQVRMYPQVELKEDKKA